jgi:hypothetical protein
VPLPRRSGYFQTLITSMRADEHARTIWAVETKSLVLDIEPERWWQ